MRAADFDYALPAASIAQVPVEPRDAARLLVDQGPAALPRRRRVADLAEMVGPGDLLVVNDTRVLPARLRLSKDSGGTVEVLLLEQRADGSWEALVRPGRRVKPGTVLTAANGNGGKLAVTVTDELAGGRRIVHLGGDGSDLDKLARHGEVPLPPYIHEPLADPERYQTVFARRPASVAAPTAGLHLTPELLGRCRDAGAEVAAVELEVGLGTFRPITAAAVEDHHMHAEHYRVSAGTQARCESAQRVVAVGTTVVRALESAALSGQLQGRTDLFIRGDHPFLVVDALLTNFHTPRSSLLVLVDAFIGSRWRQLYTTALIEGYRFLSFGDAMLLERRWGRSAS